MEKGNQQLMQGTKGKYNMSYNALRGLAAIGIFFSHMSYLGESDTNFWRESYYHLMQHGASCCSFFYIMSGFLALYTWKDIGFKEYLSGKMKRIYPLALTVLLMAMAVDVAMGGSEAVSGNIPVGSLQWWLNVLIGAAMLKAFIPIESTFYSFHGPSWYLSALVVFYMLFWLMAQGMAGAVYEKRKKIWTGVKLACIATYILQAAACLVIDIKGLKGIITWATYVNPWFRIFGECFLGMIIAAHMSKQKEGEGSGNRWMAAAWLLVLSTIFLKNIVHTTLLNAWAWAIPCTCLLAAFYRDEGQAAGILHARPFQFLGDISFELYMTHAFVYEGLPIVAGAVYAPMGEWIVSHAGTRFLITIVLSLLAAWMVKGVFTAVGKYKNVS